MTSGVDKESPTNYFLLKPEVVGFVDLVYLLFSKDVLYQRELIKCSFKEKLDFSRRWVIFVSIILQIFFVLVKGPMAWTGNLIETLLNLPSSNGGFLGLLVNIIKGKVVIPDRKSANFRSIIGLLDYRFHLDPKIKPGDVKYKPSLSMMASKLAYENKALVKATVDNVWKMEFLGSFDFENAYHYRHDTKAIIFKDKNLVVVAFRGTNPFDADAWATDVDISWYEFKGVGRVHEGFMIAWGIKRPENLPKDIAKAHEPKPYAYYKVRDLLKDILAKDENTRFMVTGHSLGGALAALFMALLTMDDEKLLLEKLEGVYTFGQPRIGDEEFRNFMENKINSYGLNYFRYVNSFDIVPRVPFDDKTLMYKHFGSCHFYSSWFHKGKVIKEEPDKNYFSLLWFIPKILNAIWELIRSFILPLIYGQTYIEGWLEILFRLFGILIPGVSEHGPQDYINLTRIGTPTLTAPLAPTNQQQDALVKLLV